MGYNTGGRPGTGTGKTAWVIDTGIDLNHADLNVDANRSRNFVTRGKDSPADGNGHGTHVAGTIGAIDNNIDVVGVAANATLVAVRVLDNSGSGYYSWVIAGVDYVASAAKSGDVANMSLGGPPSDSSRQCRIKNAAEKGIKFSIAAGNSSADAINYSPARVISC
jgi:subtilisin family serine protease